jgi:type I restriction enzyme S subunit
MRGRNGRKQIEEFSTGAQLSMRNISQDSIKKIVIPLPPLPEQEEIVRRVERLFAYADSLQQQYAALQEKLAILPQAILAKAFRGEM